jgi:hypothetical protein
MSAAFDDAELCPGDLRGHVPMQLGWRECVFGTAQNQAWQLIAGKFGATVGSLQGGALLASKGIRADFSRHGFDLLLQRGSSGGRAPEHAGHHATKY